MALLFAAPNPHINKMLRQQHVTGKELHQTLSKRHCMSESKSKYLQLHMETIGILSLYITAKERFIEPKPWKFLLAQTDQRSIYTETESLQEMVRSQMDESYE